MVLRNVDAWVHYRITYQAALANSQLKTDAFVSRRRYLRTSTVRINHDWINQAQLIDIDLSANHLFTAEINYKVLTRLEMRSWAI